MSSRPLTIGRIIFVVLLYVFSHAAAQQGQTLRIVQGKKVTLRADAEHALSYIWFHNGNPIQGQHDARIVVMEAGFYTVIALGDGCDSELSDPVKIVFDPAGDDVEVDIEIRNLPDRQAATVAEEFSFHLLVLNNSQVEAEDVVVTFYLPMSLTYVGLEAGFSADVSYNVSTKELTWRIPMLQAQESLGLPVRVKGELPGEAVTMARVEGGHNDSNWANNESEARVNIVAFFIPNVFTPNGDGVNDTFEIVGLNGFQSHRLLIFNRFGNEVYRSDNYQNDWTGQGLSQGTYFYYLEMKDSTGKLHQHKGYVLLLRQISVPSL